MLQGMEVEHAAGFLMIEIYGRYLPCFGWEFMDDSVMLAA